MTKILTESACNMDDETLKTEHLTDLLFCRDGKRLGSDACIHLQLKQQQEDHFETMRRERQQTKNK